MPIPSEGGGGKDGVQNQKQAEQQQNDDYSAFMTAHEPGGIGHRLFGGSGRRSRRLGPLSCSLPGLLGILPLDFPFLGHAGKESALKLRVLLRHLLIVEVGIGLHGHVFPFLHLSGRVLPDTPLGVAGGLMHPGLRQKLGLVGALHTHILMLDLMYFAVGVGPHTSPRRRCRPPGEAVQLLGFLLGQIFLGGFQLDSGVFGLDLGPFLLFLLFVLPGLWGVLFLMGGVSAGLVILTQAGGRLFPFLVLPEFSAARWPRANLARGGLPGLTCHFFLGKMEPPTLDPLSGRSVLFVLRVNLARSGLTHSAPPFPPGG